MNNKNYVLVSVCERDITVSFFDDFKSAHKEMIEELCETVSYEDVKQEIIENADSFSYNSDEWGMARTSCWSNLHNMNNDWSIFENK